MKSKWQDLSACFVHVSYVNTHSYEPVKLHVNASKDTLISAHVSSDITDPRMLSAEENSETMASLQ